MRHIAVCEELLPIDPTEMRPAAIRLERVLRHEPRAGASHGGDALSVGLLRRRIRVAVPPRASLQELGEAIHAGRSLADRAARRQGRRVVALATPVFPAVPGPLEGPMPDVGPAAGQGRQDVLCGMHMHIAVDSPEEGVQVLDRIRVWLPVLLALSTNSPFWHGMPSRFSSHRHFMSTKWPAPGPTSLFGSLEEYDKRMRHLTHPAAARTTTLWRSDARLSATNDTVDVLLADVCMDAEHTTALAALTRALVELLARQWRQGEQPPPATVAQLRTSSWFAALHGLEGTLPSPRTGDMVFVQNVVGELLELVHPVLQEYGDAATVETTISDMLLHGNGSRRQREIYGVRQDLHDVVRDALRRTHGTDRSDGGADPADGWRLTGAEEAPEEVPPPRRRHYGLDGAPPPPRRLPGR